MTAEPLDLRDFFDDDQPAAERNGSQKESSEDSGEDARSKTDEDDRPRGRGARRGREDRHEDQEEPRLVALVAASGVKPEHTRWLWENRIPLRGLTLAVGMEGRGKTTMVVALVAQLTRGTLAGDLRGQAVSVVYVTAEDSLSATVVPRLMAAGADLDRVHFVTVEGFGDDGLSIPGDLPALSAAMAGAGARFLILDPVVAHLHGALDSHKDQQVRQALAPLARWADAANGAVLGVMHLNKGLGADVLNRVNGSRGFTAAARSVLTVGDDPQNPEQRVVAVGKANLAPTDVAALRFRIEGRSVPHPDEDEPISTSGIVWMGEATGINSRDLLAVQTDEDERPAREEAAAWLSDLLGVEPVASKTVKAEAEKAGLAWRTVRRAKDEIGVEARRWGRPGEAGGWCWSLASAAEGVHETPKVSTLIGGTPSETGGHLRDDDALFTDSPTAAEPPSGDPR